MKLSLCLAVHNEEQNLRACLESCKNIADEIVVVDGASTDRTVEIARLFRARVIETDNPQMFHINKQKALDAAKGQWILQLDADERLSPELAKEIRSIIAMSDPDKEHYQQSVPGKSLFLRHQRLVEDLKGRVGETHGSYVAFFIPRLNYFLGTFLRHGGVYPDGAIRLVKKGKASFPCKDLHENMDVRGKVGWLQHPLLHYDSPTFQRYLMRNNRYINMMVSEFQQEKLSKNVINFISFVFYKPFIWFFSTQIRHKGFLDGWQGIVFSFFSALRFPRAYLRYVGMK